MIAANKQARYNEALAMYQNQQNMEMLKYQLDWDSPVNQMARFEEAGLNPNLMYGQGTPGNMGQPLRYPEIRPADYQGALADIGTKFQQARLMSAQTELTKTKTDESTVKQDLMQAQRDVAKANPWLNSSYVSSVVLQLESAAKIKEQEMQFMTIGQIESGRFQGQAGFVKMRYELEALAQKFDLMEKDKQIKAKIFESKEFQNALQEIQLKWMKDKEITPQHIYMGIMLLLQKMM